MDEVGTNGEINYKKEGKAVAVQRSSSFLPLNPRYLDIRLHSCQCRFEQRLNMRAMKQRIPSRFCLELPWLSVDHFMHESVAANSQVGEIIAITLLDNSNLARRFPNSDKIGNRHQHDKETVASFLPYIWKPASELKPKTVSTLL